MDYKQKDICGKVKKKVKKNARNVLLLSSASKRRSQQFNPHVRYLQLYLCKVLTTLLGRKEGRTHPI